MPLGGELKVRRGSCIWGNPSPQGDQVGQKGIFRGSEESAATSLWQAGQSENSKDGLRHGPVCTILRHSAHRDWVLECGAWRADPGRGLLLAERRQPEGTGVRRSTTRNACGGITDHHRSKVPF